MFAGDQLNEQAIRISEPEHLIAKSIGCLLKCYVPALSPLAPVVRCDARNSETASYHLAGAARAASRSWPREKGQNRPRRPDSVAEVKMVSTRIIEIHRPFHQPQAEELGVEIQISLRITGYGGNVMDPVQLHFTTDACICGKG